MSRSVEINSAGGEVVAAAAAALPRAAQRGWATTSQWAVSAALVALLCLGFGLRLSGISTIGFAEDEINKLEAVRAYEQGDIRPNAEHPMLMKALIYVSMHAARLWNTKAGDLNQITDEAALRFPNVLTGALTVLPLSLLTAAFFDRRTALAASALWAFGINAITYNRIAKEDTLLVFFMLFAFYFYLRAKQAGASEQKTKQRNYILSGAAFGLMFASKYFPHYFGLNALYHHYFRVREREPGEASGRTPRIFYLIIPIVFLIANPVVLLPQTWSYLQSYTSGQLLTHTGYLVGDHLYKNTMSATPFRGTPFYFYLLFLAIKVPLPVLAAFIVGLLECVRRRRRPGHAFLLFMFLFWIVPYSLMGAKWLRYTLSLMPFVYMIAAVGIVMLVRLAASLLIKRGGLASERALSMASLIALLVFVAAPAWTAQANAPHYAAYTNILGSGRTGYYFPHDEFYDDGLREAIRYVCQEAPQGAIVAHETPGVARYYLEKYARPDLKSRAISEPGFTLARDAPAPAYFILQRGRTYFENEEKIRGVRARYKKVFEVNINGANAVEVYAFTLN
ncbi:MAG: glycosyltransferase family 39 protein [Acidobacteria bacterium]|nr:glycosyltransferase family 39 protein [Acidobacteriota bacterium]